MESTRVGCSAGVVVRGAHLRGIVGRVLATVLLGLVAVVGPGTHAAIDAFAFDDEDQAQRYRALVDELRCPVCLSSSLSGSDSPISADLRREVYDLIKAGKSDDEIRDHMYARYGDYILYRPRLTAFTAFLYALPVLLIIGGGLLVRRLVRARRAATTAEPDVVATNLDALLARHGAQAATERSATDS